VFCAERRRKTVFNGFYVLLKTAEAVRPLHHGYTPLKRGVNDKMCSNKHLVREMFRLTLETQRLFGRPEKSEVRHSGPDHRALQSPLLKNRFCPCRLISGTAAPIPKHIWK
jgi:hypothetical protein